MSELVPSPKHNWLAIAGTFLVLFVIGLFAWRVVHFARLLQSGEVPSASVFPTAFSTTDRFLASDLPLPTGAYNVVSPDDPSLGSKGAKVTVVAFADFGCPYSRQASYTMRALSREFGDQVQFIYRDFPIEELHPGATRAAEAAECAAEQGKFWEYHDRLYLHQGAFDESLLLSFGEQTNLEMRAFTQCVQSRRYRAEVEADIADGTLAGVAGTPTFYLQGNRISGAMPEATFRQFLQKALAP